MNKDVIMGVLLGAGLVIAFHKFGLKKDKDCSCHSHDNENNEITCKEAVEKVLKEKTKGMKLSDALYEKMYKEELAKCLNS